jgi:hydrogenase nickel incorporation protein HypA/HybF
MHELSLSSAIVDTVIRHADGRPVTAVQMRIGALRQVVPDSLAFYFDIVSRDTVCEGARLEQAFVPVRLRCDACTREWEIDFPIFLCPSCETGGEVQIVAGEEFEVESIEVEEVAECTAPR